MAVDVLTEIEIGRPRSEVSVEPGSRLVMSTSQGPFPMETIYLWEDASEGVTRMTLRNRGQPAGFAALSAPFLTRAMRRANAADLGRLKDLLEA